MWFRKISLVVLFLASLGQAAVTTEGSARPLEELRMAKRFGLGISAAGPLSVMGIEIDFNISENFSISGGIGTGLDYSTFMVKGRYFLLGESVSPYIGASIARWFSSGTSAKAVSPSILANKFLEPGTDLTQGFSVWILSPSIGVQFMHQLGFSFFAELQYMFKLVNFANGTYAGLGMHWYF
jgi:hypothetical protein